MDALIHLRLLVFVWNVFVSVSFNPDERNAPRRKAGGEPVPAGKADGFAEQQIGRRICAFYGQIGGKRLWRGVHGEDVRFAASAPAAHANPWKDLSSPQNPLHLFDKAIGQFAWRETPVHYKALTPPAVQRAACQKYLSLNYPFRLHIRAMKKPSVPSRCG